MNKFKNYFSKGLLHTFLLAISVTMLLPFCWIFSTSLRLPRESFKFPPNFFPTSFHYQNYIEVFQKFPFLNFINNSLIVAFAVVFLSIIVTTMAGYAFARIPFRWRDQLFLIFIAGLMIPSQATIIPTYIIMSKIRLVGTLWALILPAIVSPMSIFFVRQYMKTIPASYEEAAHMDGASRFRIYAMIFLPMSKSVIIMTSLLCFLTSWNSFMAPLIYLSKWETMTLPIGLKVLSGYMGTGSISVTLAGVTMSLVVPTILYITGQKYILQGVALSGLKS